MPFDLKTLKNAMCAVAVSQPFATGERSMSTIVRLYLRCARDNYALVSECNGLAYAASIVNAASRLLDSKKPDSPTFSNNYDQALYSRIVEAMTKSPDLLSSTQTPQNRSHPNWFK